MKSLTQLLAIAGVSAMLAGCQTFNQSGEYKFEQVGQRTGTTMAVRLVHIDESPVVGARLYSVSWTHEGPKVTPKQHSRHFNPTRKETSFIAATISIAAIR